MPALEFATQLLTEHAGCHLKQQLCTGHRSLHLLLLDDGPLADDLLDDRFIKARRDGPAVPMTITSI